MFTRIINYVKGWWNNMFDKKQLANILDVDIETSEEILNAIETWSNIYNGQASWLDKNTKSLNVAKTISEKVAKAVTIEMKSSVDDETIDKIYQRFLRDIRKNEEYTIGKGGMVFKPFFSNGTIKVSCIQADKFIPTKFDSTGELLGGIFPDQIVKGDVVYTRLEYQELNNTTLTIKNVAVKGTASNPIQNIVSLTDIEEWSEIMPEQSIENVNHLLLGYNKVPIANPVDNNSPIGVALFANAIGTLKEIDKQFSRTLWEYEGSELAIDVDITAFKKEKGKFSLPKGKERLYRMLDLGDETTWNVFSPEIRDTSLFNGLNELLRQCESQCGLSFGVISKQESIAQTATEIKSSKQDYYVTVSDLQNSLQTALEDLVYAIDVLMTLYNIPHQVNPVVLFDWDDSIIVDKESLQRTALVEKNAGLIDDVEYFKITRDMSDDEALEFVNKIKQRMPQEPEEPPIEE